jgi:hypothetical protein
MKVKLDLNTAATVKRIKAAADAGLFEAVDIAKDDSTQYVPTREKHLKESVKIEKEPGKCLLIWDSDYARYLYYGVLMVSPTTESAWAKKGEKKVIKKPIKELVFSQSKNPQARKMWAHYAENQHGEQWKEILRRVFKLNMEKGGK